MTTLIRIGNSQGIRVPKAFIKQARLEKKNLEFEVLDEGLLIKPITTPRETWGSNVKKVLNESKNKKDESFLDDFLNDDDLEDQKW